MIRRKIETKQAKRKRDGNFANPFFAITSTRKTTNTREERLHKNRHIKTIVTLSYL